MRIYNAARLFFLFEILRRLQRGDAFWVPPGASWRLRRLSAIYRTKRDHAINAAYRAVVDEFIAEVDELRREERGRHNLAIGFDPRYRVTVTEHH